MMLGLLYKDIVSSKKWILFIWGLAVALPIGMVFDPLGMKIALPFLLVMSYTAVLLRFFQSEEKNNMMVLLKTLPIPYFMIVAAKYLLCFLTVFSSLPLFFLMSLIMPGVGISAWSGVSALFILYLFLIVLFTLSVKAVKTRNFLKD